jgi:hypothetical protein
MSRQGLLGSTFGSGPVWIASVLSTSGRSTLEALFAPSSVPRFDALKELDDPMPAPACTKPVPEHKPPLVLAGKSGGLESLPPSKWSKEVSSMSPRIT